MTFSKFVLLCNSHHNPILEHLCHPKSSPVSVCIQSLLSAPCPRQPESALCPYSFFFITLVT